MAFDNKQVMGLIAFDISKSYDSTWSPRTLKKLSTIICYGNLLNCINNFLSDRTFQVKVNWSPIWSLCTTKRRPPRIYRTRYSAPYCDWRYHGINSTTNIGCRLFADDFNIICRGKNLNSILQIYFLLTWTVTQFRLLFFSWEITVISFYSQEEQQEYRH